MVPKMSAGGHDPAVLPLAEVRRTAARRIDSYGDVGGLAVDDAELSPQLRVAHHDKGPALGVSTRRCADRRIEDLCDQVLRHRIGFESADGSGRIDRLE